MTLTRERERERALYQSKEEKKEKGEGKEVRELTLIDSQLLVGWALVVGVQFLEFSVPVPPIAVSRFT